MTRLFRIVGIAALIALSIGAHARAGLDPARVFNPGSGSFLAALTSMPRAVSLVSASIFNERIAADDGFFPAPQIAGLGFAGSGTVNLSLPEMRATFEPSPSGGLAFASPVLPDAQPALASAQAVSEQPVQVRSSVSQAPAASPTEPAHFGSYAPYTPALTGPDAQTPVSVRLGKLRFQTAFAAMQKCGTADEAAACSQGLTAGTGFNLRAGNRDVHLSLESGVTHVSNQTAGVFPYVPLDPDAQAGLTYPGVSDVFGQNMGAKLAVPVTQRITVGLQFDRAHYEGDSATSILPGFEGMRDTYLGNLTYQIKGSSAITFSARQYRYQDLLTPGLNATQTRADLNFTVKF